MSKLFENEYQQNLDTLSFTDAQKRAIAARAASAAGKSAVHRRKPFLPTALLAAAMVIVLVVGAGAAGVLPSPADILSPLFGGTAAQTEVIDKIGHPIGASDTDSGITISADAIIGDKYNAVIVYTLTRDDGERFLPEGRTLEDLMLTVGGFGGSSWVQGGSHGSAWFTDEDPDDNCVQYVETASSNVPMTRGVAKAEFEDLCYWDGENGENIPLYPGHWTLRFDVAYEDCAVYFDGGETFTQDGLTFTIGEISVSPVAVRATYTADAEVVWSDAPSGRQTEEDSLQSRRYLENVSILLTKTDGTVIDLSGSGGSLHPENGVTVCTKGGVMDEIIPLEELESISVGGIVYLIDAR